MTECLKDIIGQDSAVRSIGSAYEADRLPHGLIFAGAVGVGKATTARALGTLFLCENPKRLSPCGKCASCRAMSGNAHPDYHVITKELIRVHDKTGKSKGIELSILVIRPELIDKAAMKPGMGRGKVFVVEQAELMNPAAQNAMLKTLEEPEGRTLIVLLTDQPGLLLPTVRSRCQTISFRELDAAVIREQLVKRGIDKLLADRAAQVADGSLGRALRWIEDGVIEAVVELGGRLSSIEAGKGSSDLADWLRKAGDAYGEAQLKRDSLASKDQAVREGLTLYLRLASEYFRTRLVERTAEADRLEQLCSAIDSIVRSEAYLEANVTVSLALQQLSSALGRAFAPEPVAAR